ncbi:MAG TPA: response regulator transcription factor [Spirochaetia bacterium]|nr:response regulator transcription factor [Spirochaetia bacterium]
MTERPRLSPNAGNARAAPAPTRGPASAHGARILVVEDEEGLVLALEDALRKEGFEVRSSMDGITGQAEAASGGIDLVILDVMLPGRDGFQVCQRLRAGGMSMPILMLTARSTAIDTVMGLHLGADDYLSKPFDMAVLIARVNALLRRTGAGGASLRANGDADATVLWFGEFALDSLRMQLTRAGAVIPLNAQEYRLLEVFLRSPDRVLSRDTLLCEAWGYNTETTTRTVDVHVGWLRQKLGEKNRPRHILTVRGVGYTFVSEP